MTATKLPANRLPKCLLLTPAEAWTLREVIRPWGAPSADGKPDDKTKWLVWDFCERLYEALLHMEVEGRGEWNFELRYEDAFILNQFLKAGMVDGILVQSWMALHEIVEEEGLKPVLALELPAAVIAFEVWEVKDALLEAGGKSSDGHRVRRPGDSGGTKLSVDEAGPEVPEA